MTKDHSKEVIDLYKKMREQILAIKDTQGFKEIQNWFIREEKMLDDRLVALKGQELEVAVAVRQEVKKFISFLENITKNVDE